MSSRLKVGDRVRVVTANNFAERPIGWSGVIEEDDCSNIPFFVQGDDGSSGWFKEGEIELAATLASTRRLVPGDRVRRVSEDDSQIPSGTLGTVMFDDGSSLPYRVDFDNGQNGEWCYPRDIELVAPTPRTWVAVIPSEPGPEVKQVAPVDAPARVFTRRDDGWEVVWVDGVGVRHQWSELLNNWVRGVQEVVPADPYADAVAYFKQNPNTPLTVVRAINHARAIIEKVIADA